MKKSLRRMTVMGLVSIAVLLTALAVFLSNAVYMGTMQYQYRREARNIADTTGLQIDSSKILSYYNAINALDPNDPEYEKKLQAIKDEDYERMYNYLHDVREANELLSLSVEAIDAEKKISTTIMEVSEGGTPHTLGYEWTMPDEIADSGKKTSSNSGLAFTYMSQGDGSEMTVWRPVVDSEEQVVAAVFAKISTQRILDDGLSYIIGLIIVMSMIAVILVFIFVRMTNKRIVRPINKLAQATSTYISNQVQGDEEKTTIEQLDIKTGDEIENLSIAIKKMERDIQDHIRDLTAVTAEKERIGAELDVANHIQSSMLPSIFPAYPKRPELDIYATMTPAKEVGGDFYDFFLVDDDRLALVVADVSGKGVPAALFMVIAKTLIKNMAQTGISPKEVFEKVNNLLCAGNEAEMFVTAWLGVLEISTGNMTCANAGHEYPVIKRKDGDYELLHDKHGFVLAGLEGSRYKEYELHLETGDRIFLYTDGVPEATDDNNQLYGVERMVAALNHHKDVKGNKLLSTIQSEIDAFVGEAPQFDDITMLSLTLMPQNGFAMKKLKLRPSLTLIDKAVAFVEQELERVGVSKKMIAQMNIVVDEIFSNISRYSGATGVTLGVSTEKNVVVLRFADNGLPYDPTKKPDPNVRIPIRERKIGGLGIFMVKKTMDTTEYEYRDGFNVLTIKKQIEE